MNYPYIIKWSITDKCNLRCKHCYKKLRTCEIAKSDIDIIIKDFIKNKVACVALTGGEPLLNSHFKYIIKNLYLNNIYTEIATNGTLLTPQLIKYFYEHGIKRVQISIDGADQETNDFIRGDGTFDKIVKNIKLLESYNIKVIMAATLNHINVHQINSFINLKEKLNAQFIRFELFIPVNEDTFNLNLTEDDINYICRQIDILKNNSYILFPHMTNVNSCSAGVCMCMLNADMTISPCDLLCDELKSNLKITENTSLGVIWKNDSIFNEWRSSNFKGCRASLIKYQTKQDPFTAIYK